MNCSYKAKIFSTNYGDIYNLMNWLNIFKILKFFFGVQSVFYTASFEILIALFKVVCKYLPSTYTKTKELFTYFNFMILQMLQLRYCKCTYSEIIFYKT